MAEDVVAQAQSAAQSALAKSPIHALRDVQVQRQDDCLILAGRVDSFYHKQLAQEIIRLVAREVRLINQLEVAYDPPRS